MKSTTSWIAETIAVGSELLLGGRIDTNSVFLSEQLAKSGVSVRFKSIVGDDVDDIVAALRLAVRRAHIVLVTGGLGPTQDDRTREAVAAATGRGLKRNREAFTGMSARFAQWGRVPSRAQMRQAVIPADATVLSNSVGSAPGFALSWKGSFLAVLPGVPPEMEEMMSREVVPLLQGWLKDKNPVPQPISRHVFHTFGLPESDVDAKLKGLLGRKSPVDLGLLASPYGVLISLTTTGGHQGRVSSRARPRPDPLLALTAKIRERMADWLIAEGADSLEEVVGRALATRGLTLAIAESCTGGLIGHRLTQVPGSSAYLDRGVVCYSNQSKMDMLGVPQDLLATHGAVSAQVAAAMAKGIRERSRASIGLSVTGIAGPGGATDTKPVGLVYVGLDAGDGHSRTQEFRFHGDRATIKVRSSQAALDLLRRELITGNRA